MLTVILAVAVLQAGGAPAGPAPKGQFAPASGVPGEPPYGLPAGRNASKTEQVCFRDPVVGSKIPTRRCMSREMFVQRQQDSKDHTDAVQRDARVQTGF
ncbi:hypothetical protein [Phenylobacterium sp.]|uniref:hypothetical protein n=1 Tax=Phenylobacterium sp. TaxID=1871053 RepID=UPI0025CE4F50|nr:hypothetical protein [Phenylobacterium sp.]